MMATLDSQDRVDKVSILHAGENLDKVVRPLAEILEKFLKLGEQAEYVRTFKSGTDIADYICKSIEQDTIQKSWRFVVIISELFILECSKNAALYQKIKSKLCSQGPTQSHFALVAPINTPAEWPGSRCINLSAYILGIEGGNLTEAILQQWFGCQAKLSVEPEAFCPAKARGPDKIKVIHAMTSPEDRQRYWGKVVTAIEDVANPENTTQARLHFKQECSVAETLLNDLKEFNRCAESKNISAVVLWCSNMLSMLNLAPLAKAKFVDIICKDSKPQKLYAHFLFGIDSQQMRSFCQRLWNHLSHYRHMVYIEASELGRPNINYTPFAESFLGFWTGCKREIKSPEESIDPTLNSFESLNASNSEDGSGVNQFHPDQDQNRTTKLLPNGDSLDYGKACATQQTALALRSGNSTHERLLTNKDSWPNCLVASASKSKESQSDGASNPHIWSVMQEPASIPEGQQAAQSSSPGVVCQPVPSSCGKNKMAAGSIGSVPVDSVQGSKITDMRGQPVLNGQTMSMASQQTPSRGTTLCTSLPAGEPGVQMMAQVYQPVNHAGGINIGHNRIAASGFSSHTTAGQYSSFSTSQDITSGGTVPDSLMSQEEGSSQATLSTQPCGHKLTVQQNPFRLVSDSENLDQQLDLESCRLGISDRATAGQPQSLQLFGSDDTRENSLTTAHSMPVMPFRTDNQDNNPSSSLAEEAISEQIGDISSSFQDVSDIRTSRLLSRLSVGIKRGLKERLDPLRPAILDWRDLACHFKVDQVKTNYWRSLTSGTFSPTETLIELLITRDNEFTIDRFRDGLKAIERNDVCKFLDKAVAKELPTVQ